MADPIQISDYMDRLPEHGEAAGLKGGGGGGTFDRMEARISRLEEDSKDIKATLAEMRKDMVAIRVDLGEVKSKLAGVASSADLAEVKGLINSRPTFRETMWMAIVISGLTSAAAYGTAVAVLPKLLGK
jgi:hypothetical protein